MALRTPIDSTGLTWTDVLGTLRADALDCLQANLAVAADVGYGRGAHVALGATLRHAMVDGPLGIPVVAASLDRRLAEAAQLLGLRVTRRWDQVDGPRLRRLAEAHGPVYVVADAYTLRWVPYAGRQHMEHSFLLVESGPSCLVVDGYRNSTRWGEARPGTWRLPAAELDAAVPTATVLTLATDGGTAPALDPAAVLDANVRGLAESGPMIDRYLDAVQGRVGDPDVIAQVVLDVWLLGRSRRLHAEWLSAAGVAGPDGPAAAARHAESWLALAGQSYLAMRRAARRGGLPRPVIDELARLLHEDATLARRLAAGAFVAAGSGTAVAVRAAVVEELRAVMRVDADFLSGDQPLRALPDYSSFRLVEVIERVEAKLGVELDPDELTTEGLRSVDSLCRLFARAHTGREVLRR